METICTDYYTESGGTTMRRLTTAWLARNWWILAIPAGIAAVAAFHDLRWAIVFFALLLLVYPMALFFVVLTKALKQPYPSLLVSHRTRFGADGISIEFRRDEDDPEEWSVPQTLHYPYNSIKSVEDTGKSMLIAMREGDVSLSIPFTAFQSDEDGKEALRRVAEKAQTE